MVDQSTLHCLHRPQPSAGCLPLGILGSLQGLLQLRQQRFSGLRVDLGQRPRTHRTARLLTLLAAPHTAQRLLTPRTAHRVQPSQDSPGLPRLPGIQ